MMSTCGSRMVCRGLFLLVGVLVAIGGAERGAYTGMLGCRFNKFVCLPFEDCANDRLFGTCQRRDEERQGQEQGVYLYYLDTATLHILEDEIYSLVEAGYTWTSLYTQCVLRNILFAFRHQIKPDRSYCDRGGSPPVRYQEALLEEVAQEEEDMNDYFSNHYDEALRDSPSWSSEGPADDDDFPLASPYDLPEKKEDQFVTIHKYFADNKRSGSEEDLFDDDPFVRPEGSDLDYVDNSEGLNVELGSLLDQLSPSDLELLKSYLQGMDELREEAGQSDDLQEQVDMEEPQEEGLDEDGKGYVWRDRDLEYGGPPSQTLGDLSEDDMIGAEAGQPVDVDVGSDVITAIDDEVPEISAGPDDQDLASEGPELQTLSPPDAKLLWDLIQDKADIDKLSDDEIQRLLNYVDNMVLSLEEMKADDQALTPGEPSVHLEDSVLESGEKRAQVFNGADGPIGQDSPEVTQALPDPHDTRFNDDMINTHTSQPQLAIVSNLDGYMQVTPQIKNHEEGRMLLEQIQDVLGLPEGTLKVTSIYKGDINYEVVKELGLNASVVSKQAMDRVGAIRNATGVTLVDAGWGSKLDKLSVAAESTSGRNGPKYFVLTFVLCGCIAGIVLAVTALYIVRHHARSKEKLHALAAQGDGNEASKDYQDLCRQRMQSKSSEKPEPLHVGAARVSSVASESAVRSPSSRSSTSSWSEEPVVSNMDISTGHIVLSYMEDHLKNKDRLDQEWEALCAYEAEPNATTVGGEAVNMRKNRYSDILPYDHSRVVLSNTTNVSGCDYINANTITDHDPRNPAYIATQGPLPHTVADFWQMVWEQGSVVIVQLTKLTENGVAMCHRYWPEEGSDLYHIYEVHLVSEHIWCDDYLVRSFYLKNLQTNETRTVTQFHFLTWADLGIPGSAKALLDFRRKVNKSYRGRSCPIVVHCSDGVGRTGTYSLIDMVLNRMSKGAKEIDIAATLEHIRDQRANMVKTKEQFEFALAAVAEEVHAILKALPQ